METEIPSTSPYPSTSAMREGTIWRINAFLEGFLLGDRTWATVRLLGVGFLLFLSIVVGYITETTGILLNPDATVPYTIVTFPEFAFGPGLRYLLVPLLGLGIALYHGARYVQDIYDLTSFNAALKYLLASMFAYNYPMLTIAEGKKQIKPGEVNTLDVIGGPGFVQIDPGNVVLFERLQGPSNVLASGIHFITRFETIKEIASLDEQWGDFKAIRAITRDGIEVQVRDVKFRYRLITGHRGGMAANRPAENPYPYSVEAVKKMAYGRVVSSAGLTSWRSAIANVIDGVISNYINSHTFDQLTAPNYIDQDPRAEISRMLSSPRTRQDLKNLGAELLWFDIGYFAGPEGEDSRLSVWQAKWSGDSEVIRANGEAQRMADQEIGRAQAQADLLESILKSLTNVELENSSDSIRSMLLLRTAQVVESMTSINRPADPEEPHSSTSEDDKGQEE